AASGFWVVGRCATDAPPVSNQSYPSALTHTAMKGLPMRPVDTTGVPGQLVLALRRLRRAPGFTIAATMLLGAGGGLGISCFNVVNVGLLKPAAAGRDYVQVVVSDWSGFIMHEDEITGVRSAPPTTFETLLG